MDRREELAAVTSSDAPELFSFEGYAGTRFDGETLVIQYSDTKPRLEGILKEGGSGWDARDLTFEKVEVSSVALEEAQWDLHALASSRGEPAMVQSVSELPHSNSLEVVLSPDADSAMHTAVADLLNTRGIAYEILVGGVSGEDCTARDDCDSPQRAGVGINFDNRACSTGWVVNWSGIRRVLTAGHCWAEKTQGHVTSGGEFFGALTSVNTLEDGAHAEIRTLGVADSRAAIYRNGNARLANVVGAVTPRVDTVACVFGRNSETPRCGVITSMNSTCDPLGDGRVVYGLIRAGYSSSDGDSGGAVAGSDQGASAKGVHSCSNGRFSSIEYLATYDLGTVASGN